MSSARRGARCILGRIRPDVRPDLRDFAECRTHDRAIAQPIFGATPQFRESSSEAMQERHGTITRFWFDKTSRPREIEP